MEKSDSDIPRVDLYRKTVVFDKTNINNYENHSKTIKIKMTNIFDHEILRRIQINQPKSCRKQVKNRPPPAIHAPGQNLDIRCVCPGYTLGRVYLITLDTKHSEN